jgi:hypothetical protein
MNLIQRIILGPGVCRGAERGANNRRWKEQTDLPRARYCAGGRRESSRESAHTSTPVCAADVSTVQGMQLLSDCATCISYMQNGPDRIRIAGLGYNRANEGQPRLELMQ